MARGTTLGNLVNDLRSEVGHSLNSNLGSSMRDVLINSIQRVQRRLWDDYSWPFLRVRRDIDLQDGARYYDLPADMVFERIERVEFKYGDIWEPVSYGIGRDQYNQYDSDRDIRSWPIYRYDNYENNQIEVWPIPNQNIDATTGSGKLRIHGIRNLSALVEDSDTADLDDQLIVLYAAANILTRQRQADAGGKLQEANAHYMRLKARLSKSDTFVMGAETSDEYQPKGPPRVAVITSSGN